MALYAGDSGSEGEGKVHASMDSGAVSSPRPATGNEAKRKKAAEAAKKRRERNRSAVQQTEKPGTATPRTITVKRHEGESDEDEATKQPPAEETTPVAAVEEPPRAEELNTVVAENATVVKKKKKKPSTTTVAAAGQQVEMEPVVVTAAAAAAVPEPEPAAVVEEQPQVTPKKKVVKKVVKKQAPPPEEEQPVAAAAVEVEQQPKKQLSKTEEKKPAKDESPAPTSVPVAVATPTTTPPQQIRGGKEKEPEHEETKPEESDSDSDEEPNKPSAVQDTAAASATPKVAIPPVIDASGFTTTPGGLPVVTAAALALNSPEAIRAFLNRPAPKGAFVSCKIQRMEKLYPQYFIYLEETNQFLLAARKRKRSSTSNYLMSTDQADLSRKGPSFMGKVRSNFVGTELVVWDDGLNPKKKDANPENTRRELACVMYGTNVLGLQGPRKMVVLLPPVSQDGVTAATPAAASGGETLSEKFKLGKTDELIALQNKSPVWNEETQSYVLNFHKRVKLPSVKNFQVVRADNVDEVLMQFGRVTQYTFALDYQYPLSLIQAFGIALTSFDNKLACE